MTLEGQVNEWTPDQRQLVFPTKAGQPVAYPYFLERVWQPILEAAKLPTASTTRPVTPMRPGSCQTART